jgi:glycosyltransferase involved in cell wall biosynthesis
MVKRMTAQMFDTRDAKVSILIPVFNGDQYLEETLDSVLNQQNVSEIVIVDNGSTDKTVEIITRYASTNPKIKLIFCAKRGVANALAYGLRFTANEFIARIDADDVMEPGRTARQINQLLGDPNLGLVASQITYINNRSEVIGVSRYPIGVLSLNRNFAFRNPIAHPSVMFRKSVIQSVGGYRSDFEGAEDLDLWIRVAQKFPIFIDDLPMTRYRSHPSQISNTSNLYKSELHLRFRILISKSGWLFQDLLFRLLQLARILDLASMNITCLRRIRIVVKKWIRNRS